MFSFIHSDHVPVSPCGNAADMQGDINRYRCRDGSYRHVE
jgi:hypothetical protein